MDKGVLVVCAAVLLVGSVSVLILREVETTIPAISPPPKAIKVTTVNDERVDVVISEVCYDGAVYLVTDKGSITGKLRPHTSYTSTACKK